MLVQFPSLTNWGNEFVNEYSPYPAPLIFVLGSLSLLCSNSHPSQKQKQISHFHPGLFLTPADFLLPSQLLPFSSSLPAGSVSVLLTKITLSAPVCT